MLDNSSLHTRFTCAPNVFVSRDDERVYITCDEMHETFLYQDGEWSIDTVSRMELTISYKRLKDTKKAWQLFRQALSRVGYM